LRCGFAPALELGEARGQTIKFCPFRTIHFHHLPIPPCAAVSGTASAAPAARSEPFRSLIQQGATAAAQLQTYFVETLTIRSCAVSWTFILRIRAELPAWQDLHKVTLTTPWARFSHCDRHYVCRRRNDRCHRRRSHRRLDCDCRHLPLERAGRRPHRTLDDRLTPGGPL
jgi:hypothetical protein